MDNDYAALLGEVVDWRDALDATITLLGKSLGSDC